MSIASQCDWIDYWLENSEEFKKFYYKMDEKLFPHYYKLDGSYLNPYMEKFQEIMDRAVEAGLPKIWKLFYKMKTSTMSGNSKESNETSDLTFEDLKSAFLTILILFILIFLIFLCEIFYHDFLRFFKIEMLVGKPKKKKMKVKRIQVTPIE